MRQPPPGCGRGPAGYLRWFSEKSWRHGAEALGCDNRLCVAAMAARVREDRTYAVFGAPTSSRSSHDGRKNSFVHGGVEVLGCDNRLHVAAACMHLGAGNKLSAERGWGGPGTGTDHRDSCTIGWSPYRAGHRCGWPARNEYGEERVKQSDWYDEGRRGGSWLRQPPPCCGRGPQDTRGSVPMTLAAWCRGSWLRQQPLCYGHGRQGSRRQDLCSLRGAHEFKKLA